MRGNAAVMVKRPPAPPWWRNIAPALLAASRNDTPARRRHWSLVLQAKGIRHKTFERNTLHFLYVPLVAERAALHEILAFERERPLPPPPAPSHGKGLYWYAVPLALLVPWHSIRWSGTPLLPFLPETPRAWLAAAGLDAYRVSVSGEWWRAVTSLSLHADAAHLVSNLVMGIVFGIPLCRHTGVGFGFLLTILAGAMGNIITAYMRPASFLSQGFSTAVFASVGLLAAFAAVFAARHAADHALTNRREAAVRQGLLKAVFPLGAGMGVLAMFGGGDTPGVDYLAHVMGLACGVLTGLGVGICLPRLLTLSGSRDTALQAGSLAAAFGLLALCWRAAL